MADPTEAELKDRCKSAIVAGGPCRWDPNPNVSRASGDSCSKCEITTLCDGGGVDPPAPSPDGNKCKDVTCFGDDCPGSCCVKGRGGSCDGPRRLLY